MADDRPVYLSGNTRADEHSVNVEARVPESTEFAPADAPPDTARYYRATPDLCALLDLDIAGNVRGIRYDIATSCAEGIELGGIPLECAEGEEYSAALFRQVQTSTGWGEPELVAGEECRAPADLSAEAARAWGALQIAPPGINVQPPDGWTLVNIDTITYTQGGAQEFDVVLLGTPVTIRAVPTEFTWDYGDGTPALVTIDPGAPYPRHTISHAYAAPGSATVSLTTSWRGQFRVAGETTWTDVPGTAVTQSSSGPIEVHEARTRLVEDLYP
ncbi:PKD domain-containing protein [Antribacter sp. KLBMP9083]|uniref:PKD domain-containing protein n=1 Tax=Antribacter soli TaxID=2910976 RepID=A0AA41QBH6_9MICO|nr:PKD domain-containing protein [Antribacter soli]MCF4120400.1 PKD domain-containing protein [Antribacter soli]